MAEGEGGGHGGVGGAGGEGSGVPEETGPRSEGGAWPGLAWASGTGKGAGVGTAGGVTPGSEVGGTSSGLKKAASKSMVFWQGSGSFAEAEELEGPDPAPAVAWPASAPAETCRVAPAMAAFPAASEVLK